MREDGIGGPCSSLQTLKCRRTSSAVQANDKSFQSMLAEVECVRECKHQQLYMRLEWLWCILLFQEIEHG
jgi:hypothetical protein